MRAGIGQVGVRTDTPMIRLVLLCYLTMPKRLDSLTRPGSYKETAPPMNSYMKNRRRPT